MKKIASLSILAALMMAVMTFASCMSETTFDGVDEDLFQQNGKAPVTSVIADLSSQLGGTKSDAARSSFKTSWDANDFVRVYNKDNAYTFYADAEGMATTFTAANEEDVRLSGDAYAFYPASVELANGQGAFSLAGQNGKIEQINRYFLLTAASKVETNGYLPFSFNEHVTVLSISLEDIINPEARVQKVVLSGNGVSSKLSIDAQNGQIRVSGADNSPVELVSPTLNAKSTFFVALYNEGAQDVHIDVVDNMEGHFFATVSGASLSAGQIANISSFDFDGGYVINFSADVAEWSNEVNANN